MKTKPEKKIEKKELTPKQQKIYEYFVGNGNYNVLKTAEHFGNSLSTTFQHLQRLVAKGWLVNDKWQKPAYRPTTNEISDYARGYQLGYQKGYFDAQKEYQNAMKSEKRELLK